eukprot:15239076-Alexandrium_andersonii.AAC.1
MEHARTAAKKRVRERKREREQPANERESGIARKESLNAEATLARQGGTQAMGKPRACPERHSS